MQNYIHKILSFLGKKDDNKAINFGYIMRHLLILFTFLITPINAGFSGIYFGLSGGINLGNLKKDKIDLENTGYNANGFLGISKTIADAL
jgi:hypothetical protein